MKKTSLITGITLDGYGLGRAIVVCMAVIGAFSVHASSQDAAIQQQLDQLQDEIAELKAGQHQHDKRPFEHAVLNVSGFGSISVTQMSEDAVGPSGEDDHLSINPHSLMGLQLNAMIAPRTEAVIQLVAEGADNFDPRLDWLYLSYGITERLSAKAGRFVFAAFTESANAKVGYTYPTVTPVDEVYALTFIENIDGISVDYRFNTGDWSHNLNVIWGNRDETIQDGMIRFSVKDLLGFALESEQGPWLFRLAAYHSGKSNVDFEILRLLALPVIPAFKNTFYNAGFVYDDGNWLFQYEYGLLKTDSDFIGDTDAHSVLLAKRFNNLQPYMQLATYDTDTADQTGFFYRTQTSYTLGLRQDLRQNIALKYQLKYVTDFDGSQGLFNYGMPVQSELAFDDVVIGDISLQFIF